MFWALKLRTLTKPLTIIFLIISQLYFCPQIYCEIYKWVDKEGNLHISQSPPPDKDGHTSTGDSPPLESNKKGQGKNLSSGPQNVTGFFFKRLAEDFLVLPKIQVEKKYSKQIIKSSGTIQSLEYLSGKNVSKIIILVYSEVLKDRRFVDRYLVVIEYPGTEIALNYKKSDDFCFQGSFIGIERFPLFDEWSMGYKFYIYFKPIL